MLLQKEGAISLQVYIAQSKDFEHSDKILKFCPTKCFSWLVLVPVKRSPSSCIRIKDSHPLSEHM